MAAIAVVFVCSLALGALMLGYGLCRILHRQWSGRTAALDMLTAIGTATTCAVIMALLGLDAGRAPIWIAGLTLLGVVLVHVARHLAAGKAPGAAA
ncbi:MAG: hypothetical protein ACJ79K_17210 [Gemmatimonadaceae bacterium]